MKGVLCPVCKTKHHEVRETRAGNGVIIRKRQCFNEHTFKTEERVVGVHKRESIRAKALNLLKRNALPREDSRYLSVGEIAAQLNVSRDTLYRIKRGEVAARQLRRK